ncbi:MAG: AprI/Inh family metalloprotease inhibitor [Beijerinckiaceae bacterium]|nr:AprI/Inh family metalloprotease inhibitor [Beijerinckiaceae bacterium]
MLVLLPLGGLLAGCEASSRLGSMLPGEPYRPASRNEIVAAPPPLTPAPAGEVESSALPPPPGANVATAPPPVSPGEPFPPATGTINPPLTTPQGPVPGANPANRTATAPVAPPVTAAPSAPTRTGLIGNWSVRESNGASCRVTLSSAPKLDLYGAGTSGCQNRELQRVNAWELAGSEVILYEPGGGVVARLRQAGQQNFSGATAKSGAPLTMSK